MVQVASGGVSNQIWWWHGDQTLVCWPALEDARELTLEAQPAYLSLYRPPGEGGTLIPIPGPSLGGISCTAVIGQQNDSLVGRVHGRGAGQAEGPGPQGAARFHVPVRLGAGHGERARGGVGRPVCLATGRRRALETDAKGRGASPMKRRRPPPACPCILLRSAKKCEPA